LDNYINFVFCIDDNYNLQTSSCILSLLENIDEKINIFIIHKTMSNSSFLSDKILENKNLNEIKIFKFDRKNKNFPNVEGKHVSEATYYRLYLEDYINPINSNVKFITYLDGDIICLQNPLKEIKKIISKMKNEKYVISANTETIRNSDSEHRFNSLGMYSNKYFNAGVMIINLEEWFSLGIKEKSAEIIKTKSQYLELWDQDVLNICFDNNYLELDNNLNFRFDILKFNESLLKKINSNAKLLHYYGSTKPWSIKGIIYGCPTHYQESYRNLDISKYHITHKWRRLSLFVLIGSILNLKFFKIEHRTKFLIDALKSFIS
jgi:lipopolysaccharide biosynthesis glycosyltransferase